MRTPEECFTAIQSGHILNHSKANNGQAGVDFLITRKWKDHKVTVSSISGRVSDRELCIIKRYKLNIVKVYAPTTSNSDKDINNFYNDVDDTLGKSNHYTIVMGDFNAQLDKLMYPMATGKFGLGLRNERGDNLVEWATPRKYKITNTVFQKKAGMRWMWKSANGVAKTETDYILTNSADIVTDVTVSTKSTLEVTTDWL